jgi:hypothetical protein
MCLERLVVVVMEGKWSLTTESNCVNLVPKTSGQPMTQRENYLEASAGIQPA